MYSSYRDTYKNGVSDKSCKSSHKKSQIIMTETVISVMDDTSTDYYLSGVTIMEKIDFRCDKAEKDKFLKQAEDFGVGGAFLLRKLVHLFLTDFEVRRRALTLEMNNGKREF